MTFAIRSIAAIACASLTSSAFAHHPGGAGNTGGAGPINTQSASTLDQGRGTMGIVVTYNHFNTLSDDALEAAALAGVDDVHDLKTIQSYALTGAYGVTNDLTLSFYLPYVHRTGIREAEAHDDGDAHIHDHGPSDGIGDLQVLGQYRFLNDRANQFEAAILLGFKAPTGRTSERDNEGETFDAEFQSGAGSWGGLFGAALTKRSGAWSFDTSFLYELATEGTQNSDLGDQFLYNAAISYRAMGQSIGNREVSHQHTHNKPHTHSEVSAGPALDLVLELNGIWHDNQVTDGVTNENSGGHTLFVSPGLRLSQGQLSGYASFGIPIVDHVNGIQPDPDWRITSGLSIQF